MLLHVISQIILSNGVQQQKVIFTKTIDCPSETILNTKLQGRLSLAIAEGGGGGALKANLGGGVSSTPSILTLFKTKSRSFLYPD